MAAVRGSGLLIKRGDGGGPEVFTTLGGIQNGTLSLNGDPIEVTTADDVDVNNEIWRAFITGPKTLSVSGEGISKNIAEVQGTYDDWAKGTIRNWQIVVPNLGTFELAMIVGTMEFTGPYEGTVGFTIALQPNGAPTFTAE